VQSILNYQELIHRPEGARMHIINHKQACGLMVFPDGIGLGIGGCFWAVFAQGAKVCDNRGLRSKKSSGLACAGLPDCILRGSAKELS
jgi:hypothetical protein